MPLLEETAWQRGKRWLSELANSRALTFMILSAPIFAAAGGAVALTVSWPLRAFLSALIGLGVAVLIALVIPGLYALLYAPFKQRDQAREYAAALETHVQEYVRWARRREIAYDFRHDTLADVRRISGEVETRPQLMGSVADEEARWRTILTQIGAQIEQNGADVSVFMASQLGFLDNIDGAFEGDDIGRIRSSMLSACQNLVSDVRQEGPPAAPTPPRTGGSDQ